MLQRPTVKQGERGSSSRVERESLLPSEVEGKKLYIENSPEEMDLV
jgi:hypothetical protein